MLIIPLKYGKGARIKILVTKADGTTQHYWVSLDKFMDMKKKGLKPKPISKPVQKSISGKIGIQYESDFINNFVEFGSTGLKIGQDTYEAKLKAEVILTKNGEPVRKLKINLNREKLARIALEYILKGKK